MIRVLALLVLLPTAGCSLVFVKGLPPPDQRNGRMACTRSKALPTVDFVIMATQLARAALALALPDSAYKGLPISREADAAIGGAAAVLFGLSGGIGTVQVNDCREATGDDGFDSPYRPARVYNRRRPTPPVDATSGPTPVGVAGQPRRPKPADDDVAMPPRPAPAPAAKTEDEEEDHDAKAARPAPVPQRRDWE